MEMVSSGGKVSSKRCLTLGGFSLIAICTLSELFFGFQVSSNTFTYVVYLTGGGTASVLLEKFSKKTPEQ